jgi:hypothetical protein
LIGALFALALIAPLLIPLGGESLVLLLMLVGAVRFGYQRWVSKQSGQAFDFSRQERWLLLCVASIFLMSLLSVLWSALPRQSLSSAC